MKFNISVKILLILLLLLITAGFLSGTIVVSAAEGGTVMKSFSQLTQSEKERVLESLIESGTVPPYVSIGSGNYTLNEQLWMERGIIAYGITANVNAANQTTGSPNYKEGQYRYWGYDLNCGLYCNDDFPRDSDTGTAAHTKDWLTINQIATNQTAANYVGKFAIQAGFSAADKYATATAFLDENQAWRNAGLDEDYIIEHFYFNSVLSDSGLTQGQFIGVHKSRYDNNLYYQTFSVEGEVMLFEVPPEKPELPEGPEEPSTPPPQPEPGVEISVNPELSLPPTTYVGHPALAEDFSVFLVDEEPWSAPRTYAEGKATNSFTAPGGHVKRISEIRATITYQTPGSKQVTLKVTPRGGSTASVSKPIQVMDTPSIIHQLTGPLKQNRKTTLHITIAKNPDVELATLWIRLEHPETGEKVTLHHDLVSGNNNLSNGETIKTRPIFEQDSNEYFLNCRLEFLTKNTENTDYRYTVYVEDKSGKTDQVTTDFSVARDKPPEAKLFLESCYIRDAGSNRAQIIAEDGTATDGDQIRRTWFYRRADAANWILPADMDSFVDFSFGTGKKVGFPKEGVGAFEIKLIAKDVWVEETLPEYITEIDYLTAEAFGTSEVINVAPIISLDSIPGKTADITILAGGRAEYDRVKANLSGLEQELLRQRVDARITLEKMVPMANDTAGQAVMRTATINTPFGYEGEWTFYENENYIVDDERLYKIDASWPGTDTGGYPESPYTISCWDFDAVHGDARWTFTFSDEMLPVPAVRTGPYFAQDDTGRYLYFVVSGKTLILTKDNGSYLTLLNMEVGKNCFVEKDHIYTLKKDGIYRISALTGQIQKIFNGSIMDGAARKIGGRIHFVTHNGNYLYRGLFDPETESTSLEALPVQHYGFGSATHSLLGIDTEGKLMILSVLRQRYASGEFMDSYIKTVRVYDRSNGMVYLSPAHGDSSNAMVSGINPVYDEGGLCNYLAFTWDSRSSSYRYVNARVLGIFDGFDQSHNIRKSGSDYPSCGDKVPFVKEVNGEVYVTTGAYWVYVYNMGYGIYQQRLKLFVFDPESGTAREGDFNEIGIPISTVENGHASDVLAAVQVGYNTPGAGESINYILKWNQSLPQILNRYISKNIKAEKDINALIVYDETNPASLYTSDLMSSLASKMLAGNGRFIVATREEIENGEMGEAILSVGEEERSLLGVSVAEGEVGALSKAYDLDPNTTYYYEYEIKASNGTTGDVLNVTHNTTLPSGAQFDSATYRTVASYSDDFENAEKTNSFFNYANMEVDRYSGLVKVISEGYYKGADLRYKRSSGNGYYTDPFYPESTAITFTVPEGKQGFLSFDYLLEKGSAYGGGNSAWTQSYVKIDGKLWDACVPNSGTGHYSHPALLEPGEHVITFHASEYGREITAKMWLDSIRVDLLEEAEGDLPGNEQEIHSAELLAGGYARIKGSFDTLPEIAAYGRVQNAEVINGPVGVTDHTVWTNTNQDRLAFNYEIPAGKTAIFTRVSTLSNPVWRNDRNESVTYTLPLYYMNKESGWINHTWTALAQNRYPQDAMRNWDNDGTIIPGELEGTKSFSLTASGNRGARGNFTNITSVLVDTERKGWGSSDFFLTGEASGKNYFLQKEEYKGSELTFELPQGDHLIRNFKVYSIRDGVKVYAESQPFSDPSALSEWMVRQADIAIIQEAPADEEETGLVYRINELVHYGIDYYDYEEDPSKKQYWRYTHTPFNMGPHPDAAVILDDDNNVVSITGTVLNEPIRRFSVDGKYTVEHWQEDNTSRPAVPAGNPDYDKLSNVEKLTFYVQGSGNGPWIESIGTLPKTVKEGESYRLQIRVDDEEKDELRLTTELYRDRKLIFAQTHTDIRADAAGNYPTIVTNVVPFPAVTGQYEVVCTVRDHNGTGMGNYRFGVISEGRITGRIDHTAEWDENRKKYNMSLFGNEFNQKVTYEDYTDMQAPRKRGANVFWSGERFILTADVAGRPQKVTAQILGDAGYETVLASSGKKNPQGETIYKGELWDRTMLNRWGKSKPQQVHFRFTAEYEVGVTKTFDDWVIVDNNTDYWLLHRLW